jgi:hypothetical protein
MLIPQKEEVISRSPELDLTAANFAAQTKKITIPRSGGPIEQILIVVQVTLNAAVNACVSYGLLNILKRATLNLNDGTGAYDAVYASGPALCILAEQEGHGLDASTRLALSQSLANVTQGNVTNIQTGGIFRIVYPINVYPRGLQNEWLRLRSLIPAPDHKQDPLLTMDFAAAAEISGVANPFSAVNLEIFVTRRDMPEAINKQIRDQGGYIRWDLRETPYDLATSLTNVEKRFAVPSPGEYATLCMHMLKGNTILTPADLSATTTVGSETVWRLEAAQNAQRTWRMKHRQIVNDQDRNLVQPYAVNLFGDALSTVTNLGVTGGGPPVWVTAENVIMPIRFGGALSAGLAVQDPSVVGFDFISGDGGPGNDFGGCLNANFPNDSIKWEIVGTVTTPATQTSTLALVGRRYRDDITKWKNLPVV